MEDQNNKIPKMDFDNCSDVTLEDVKKWKAEIEKSGIKSRLGSAEQKISMDKDRVYLHGPIYGNFPRSTYDRLMQEFFKEMLDKK